MPAAARAGDMHSCPAATGTTPHVGGPIVGPGVATVLIGGMPAAVISTPALCVGPSSFVSAGSQTVLIGGLAAARQGDATAHGGVILTGFSTVLIGG